MNACRIACEGVVDTSQEADLIALLEPESELWQFLKEAGCEQLESVLKREELGLAELRLVDREDLRRTLNVPADVFSRLWTKVAELRIPAVSEDLKRLRDENEVSAIDRQKLKSLLCVDEPPEYFLCPLTHELLTDPVTMADGYSYERLAAQDWLSSHSVSPVTGQNLSTRTLRDNLNLQQAVRQFRSLRSQFKVSAEPRRNLYATSYGHHLPDLRLQELADMEREAKQLANHFFHS